MQTLFPKPSNPLLQGYETLAKHPLSFHPQGMFGSREREKKMKENGERWKQRGNYRPLSIAKSEVIDSLYILRLI